MYFVLWARKTLNIMHYFYKQQTNVTYLTNNYYLIKEM